MNLEAVKERCLAHLKQVANPLVPFEVLFAHVREDEACSGVTRQELLGFLRSDEMFRVVEPVGLATDSARAKDLEEAGLPVDSLVILSTRVPTTQEIVEQINRQMEIILDTLIAALGEARQAGYADRVEEIRQLLDNAQDLRERIRQFE